MFLSMFLRIGVWRSLWRAYRRGFGGNLRGEGLVLGGVFVIGPGDQVGINQQSKKVLTSGSATCCFKEVVFFFFFPCRVFYWSTVRRSLGTKWIHWQCSEQPAKCMTAWQDRPSKMWMNGLFVSLLLCNNGCSMPPFACLNSISLVLCTLQQCLTCCTVLILHFFCL